MSCRDDKGTNYIENDEDDSLCKYGTQLPQYEQVKSIKFNFKKFWQKIIFLDKISSKKPFQVEDMVVKDDNGRRRLYRAYTGVVLAGYWNTIGSKEGKLINLFFQSFINVTFIYRLW